MRAVSCMAVLLVASMPATLAKPPRVTFHRFLKCTRAKTAMIRPSSTGEGSMAIVRQPVQSGFSRITQALSDPAREAMVSALADGKAMPAGELASAAGISAQSASAHLQKLVEARVLSVWPQGRFRYYRIAFRPGASPHARLCNDWTVRVPHLSGPFPTAILKRLPETRCVAPRGVPR